MERRGPLPGSGEDALGELQDWGDARGEDSFILVFSVRASNLLRSVAGVRYVYVGSAGRGGVREFEPSRMRTKIQVLVGKSAVYNRGVVTFSVPTVSGIFP